MDLRPGKKIYFISDFHLGAPDPVKSLEREKRIVRWLEMIKNEAAEIYLLGDVFDFWFEYKRVVPRGYVRLLGKLAELSDAGVKIHYFTGNHDMWVFDYLPAEIGMTLYRKPVTRTINGKTFYIGHGDGLGPGDHSYKFIKKVFANPVCQWLFARLHPNFGIGLANYFSRKSRIATGTADEKFLGEENEWLVIYSKEILQKEHFDFFIFGHRHLPIDMPLPEGSRYLNLGEWINHNTYAEFDGTSLLLKTFES
ncbi:MAG TPA: UDP-2,3-diacylglucosamine diphosphatase [Bacteroidia bacterium]|nr:UDP-2,3-diacylglucosamine diphosphatase [Bacteroidia bacterium]